MQASEVPASPSISFETHPNTYRHWKLEVEPPLAWLTMAVAEDAPLVPGYRLKLNSYDPVSYTHLTLPTKA